MVMYALAAMLVPLVMAGNIPMMQYPQQQGWNQQQGWGQQQQGWGVQMQGTMQMGGGNNQQQQQQQQASNQWWGMENEDDYEAYMKWCEERRMAIAEQEQQEQFLKELEERAESKKREMAREAAMKENKAKRETMVAQWRMWQAQLSQAEEFDGQASKYTEMKTKYMFAITLDFLKFCKCSDYTTPLQRYLMHDGMTFEPGTSDAFSLKELEGLDSTNVDEVARRMAGLSDVENIKLFFGGTIEAMCNSVKVYVDQVQGWESQYNFLGM